MNTALSIVIGVAVFAIILHRQLRPRPLAQVSLKPLALAAIGVINTGEFLHTGARVSALDWAAAVIGLALSVLLAWPRAASMSVWQQPDGTWWCRGTAGTVGWWFLLLGSHLGLSVLVGLLSGAGFTDPTGGLAGTTFMIDAGVSFALQAWLRSRRVPSRSGPRRPVPPTPQASAHVRPE